MGVTSQVYWIELVLFYGFAVGIIVLPIRWSLLCLLLGGSVAVNAPDFVSVSSVSWQNAAEAMVLPVLLMLRLTRFRLPTIKWTIASKAWVALLCYAAISTLWSPFRLSGLKMVAYLAAWLIIYLIFDFAWHRGLLDQGIIIWALWGSLALAVLQTYVLGNPLFGMEGRLGEFVSAQFAPFRGPQFFGPFLACLLTLLLFSRERRALWSVSVGACLLALVLVGSRYSLIEAGVVVFAWYLVRAKAVPKAGRVRLGRAFEILFLAALILWGFRGVMAWAMPGSRVNQLLDVGSKPDVIEQGDFGWRLLVYQRTFASLSKKSLAALALGSGTSSGGEVITTETFNGSDTDMDPNRTIHDEFLRAEYEWGFIGLGLGLGLLIYGVRRLCRRAFRFGSLAAFGALAIIPGILLALLVENPLAGPASAEGLGYLLVLTYGFAVGPIPTRIPESLPSTTPVSNVQASSD